jgi:hypothetical protein
VQLHLSRTFACMEDGAYEDVFSGLVFDTPAQLGRAGVTQAVALLTAADQMPETLDGLVDELCVHATLPLRVASAAALLMLGYEVAVSVLPPEVRLADAVMAARSEVVDRFGADVVGRVFDATVTAAAAHCNDEQMISAALLHQFLGDGSSANLRFEMLMCLTLLCSAWVGESSSRRTSLLGAVGLAAA